MRIYINEETAVIEVQNVPSNTGPVNCMKTFDDVVSSTPAEIVGKIPDLDTFSASLGWDQFAPKKEFYIKAPGSQVIIPAELKQFIPTLKNIFEQRGTETITDEYCIVGVVHSCINPNQNTSKPFIHAHKDVTLSRLRKEPVPVSEIYVACDSLQTGFSSREFSAGELNAIKIAENPDQVMQEILGGWNYKSFSSGVISKFDTTTPHAFANPEKPTYRTALIVNFTTDSNTNRALSTTPGLMQFDHETWEVEMKSEFSALEL